MCKGIPDIIVSVATLVVMVINVIIDFVKVLYLMVFFGAYMSVIQEILYNKYTII